MKYDEMKRHRPDIIVVGEGKALGLYTEGGRQMSELKWKWAYYPYLDPPEKQKESALKAGYIKVVNKDDVDEMDLYIAELEQKLSEKDKEIESLKASHYAEMVDAGMRERRLRRALWIARAELCRRLDVDRYLRKHRNSWYNENCLTWNDACVAMEVKMCKAESKCRAKAEEYK